MSKYICVLYWYNIGSLQQNIRKNIVFFFFFGFFFGHALWHEKVPRSGIQPEPQQWPESLTTKPPGNSRDDIAFTAILYWENQVG